MNSPSAHGHKSLTTVKLNLGFMFGCVSQTRTLVQSLFLASLFNRKADRKRPCSSVTAEKRSTIKDSVLENLNLIVC